MQTLCKTEDVPLDEPLRVELENGLALAVYRWEDAYYCSDDICSHGEASLAEGYVENGEIVCPFHLGSFCIKTGEARRAPCSQDIKVYAVTERDGVLLVDIPG